MSRSRTLKGRVGPYRGEYYDNMARPIAGGMIVAWRGKKLLAQPSLGHDWWPFVFSDGSWAEPTTGRFYDAPGRGKLIAVTGDEAKEAARAFGGHPRG